LITYAVDGFDEVVRSVAFDLFAHLRDVLVERACGAEVVDSPDFVEQLIPGENLSLVLLKHVEEFEFAGG
jgi:hypothetical protein